VIVLSGVVLVLVAVLGVILFTALNFENKLNSHLQQESHQLVRKKKTLLAETKKPIEKISSVFIDSNSCNFKVTTTTKRVFSLPTGFLASGETRCYQFALAVVSQSGQYIAFEDVSTKGMALINLYSLKANNIIKLKTFSRGEGVLDVLFLPNNLLTVLVGPWGMPGKQKIITFAVEKIANQYPLVPAKNYRYFTHLSGKEKIINLPSGYEYDHLLYKNNKLQVTSPGGVNPGLIQEYNLQDLRP